MATATDTSERLFTLPDGRTLAYSTSGNPSSETVVLSLHGTFTVGDASRPPRFLRERNWHIICPTLPGWGNSSPVPPRTTLVSTLPADMAALLKHLHPEDENLELYVTGGSFGTVSAQIIYGAAFDVFPQGKHLKGLLLMGAFSPFYHHKDYAKLLSTQGYMSVGPPARILPFRILPRLAVLALRGKLNNAKSAEAFLRTSIFDRMDEKERADFASWREENGLEERQVIGDMVQNTVRSVSKSWEGFMGGFEDLHADWGFRPDTLDEEHAGRPIFVVAGTRDDMTPPGMAKWIGAHYKNARVKLIEGGHIVPLFHMDEIWKEFLEDEGSTAAAPS